MTEQRRAHERISFTVPVTLTVCDRSSEQPISGPFPAQTVNVSAGGLKLELPAVPSDAEALLRPEALLLFELAPGTVSVNERMLLRVAWYHPGDDRAGNSNATLGAYFFKLSDGVRDALLEAARGKPRRAQPSARGSIGKLAPAALALLTLILGTRLYSAHGRISELEAELASMNERAEKREELLASQSQTLMRMRSELRPRAQDERRPSAPPPPPQVAPAPARQDVQTAVAPVRNEAPLAHAGAPSTAQTGTELGTQPPAAQGDEPTPLRYRSDGLPEGTDVVGLRWERGTVAGTLRNGGLSTLEAVIKLEYECAEAKAANVSRCICQTAQLFAPASGNADFTCLTGPKRIDGELLVRVEAL